MVDTENYPEPAAHSYLNLLETVSISNSLVESDIYEIVLIPLRDVVLFPGETIPLRLDGSHFSAIVRFTEDQQRQHESRTTGHLGICNHSAQGYLELTGTTTEVRSRAHTSTTDERDEVLLSSECFSITVAYKMLLGYEQVVLTAKGCHRFKVLKHWKQNGLTIGSVQILPEAFPRSAYIDNSFKIAANAVPQWV